MNQFRSRWARIFSFFAVIFTFAVLLTALFSSKALPGVQAEEKTYLQVKSSDFTVCSSENLLNRYYRIALEYSGEENLPHNVESFSPYVLEVDGEEFSLQEKNGKLVNLSRVSHYDSTTRIAFDINLAGSENKVGYTNDIDVLIIKPCAKLGAQDATNYLGIEFTDGLTLVRDGKDWIVQETQSDEDNYDVELNATNVELGWDEDGALLQATIAFPFTQDTDVSYASTLNVQLNNTSESVTVMQYAGESTLHLLFEEYVAPSDNEIPCIRIQGGELTDLESGTVVTVSGDISFYEYVDGTWATEKYVQLKETVLGITTEQKLGAGDTYEFALPQAETDKLYLGWLFQGNLVQADETVEIVNYTKRTIETEAVFVGYSLIAGASIRYDQTDENSGIRFGVKLLTEDFDAFGEYIQGVGIIVMPSDLLSAEEFTLANYGAEGQAKNFFVSSAEIASEKEYFTLYASIVKILLSNYNRAFCARAYVLTENGEYVWTSNVEQRSIYQVATIIMDEYKEKENLEPWKTKIVETYLNEVANVTYENGETKLVSSALSPAITAAETVENGNFVTLTLTTQKTSFASITYNGKRVKNATQSYADGILTITFDKTQAKA